jgi:hypothetical protein
VTTYPVHYGVTRPEQFSRVQLAVRVLAFVALGLIGLSFGTIFLFAYLALPVLAAVRINSVGARAYVDEDGPSVLRALHWMAAICAWAGLASEELPRSKPAEVVSFTVDGAPARPTPRAAIARVLTGLPSALVLGLLCWIGAFVWLWAAISILLFERVGPHAFNYLVGLQRWSVRLLAYQAALVDDYPPFSFSDEPPSLPQARATA